ncbi:MAG: LysM peptidoglycan-binding domain-containing protein [Rhodocyclaceae bacterium]|nr:LysM peptidoglycan-binding domain-containing protein [Rhodocyclaceae bacterium]
MLSLKTCSAVLLGAALLAGCASHAPAPVEQRDSGSPVSSGKLVVATVAGAGEVRPGFYMVKKGDTLYSISLDHGQNYRDIAAWNNLDDPNKIQVGQQLRVSPPEGAAPVEARPLGAPAANTDTLKKEPKAGKQPYSEQAWAQAQKPDAAPVPIAEKTAEKPAEKPADKPAPVATAPAAVGDEAVEWAWPAAGKVSAGFVEGSNKGVDIPGKAGDAVHAAAAGKVTLVSNALRGYGNLVVIKHNTSYLSVYAHNSKILVKEGQSVTKGQKIAEVGSSDTDSPKLHFEIRRQGKPVDPVKYLPAR